MRNKGGVMIFNGEKDWYRYSIWKENDKLYCKILVTKQREFLREEKRTISQLEVFDLCSENLSKSEKLGRCEKPGRVNNFSNDVEDEWVFSLIVEKPKTRKLKNEKNI